MLVTVISDRIFPTVGKPIIEGFAGNETAKILDATLYPLESILAGVNAE